MTFETFVQKVEKLLKAAGYCAVFRDENGRHVAFCPEGVTIVGNTKRATVSVNWGSGHTAIAHI